MLFDPKVLRTRIVKHVLICGLCFMLIAAVLSLVGIFGYD